MKVFILVASLLFLVYSSPAQKRITIPAFFDTTMYFPDVSEYAGIIFFKDAVIDFKINKLRKYCPVFVFDRTDKNGVNKLLSRKKQKCYLLADCKLTGRFKSHDTINIYLEVLKTTYNMFNGSLNPNGKGTVKGIQWTDLNRNIVFDRQKQSWELL